MMKCLDPAEAGTLLKQSHFSVRLSERGEGIIGSWNRQRKSEQSFACQPPADPCSLPDFLGAINRWLPSNTFRVLWINDWSLFYPTFHPAVFAIRIGEGDRRSLSDAPGHFFPAHSYAEEDQAAVSDAQVTDVGLLFALLSLFIIEQWSVVLLAGESCDYVEFWDGNIVFKSPDSTSMSRAREIASKFKLQTGTR
jgi:hypothetical protein